MELKYPDYKNGLVNLACSVLKYFGAEYKHSTLTVFDRLLDKGYKNVVVMLFDGMGMDALMHHLEPDSFLRRHLVSEISSVFPPTTTSATTTLESGLTPAEHGWLGWSLYFSEIDKVVNAFFNTVKDSNEKAADYHVAARYLPYKTIYEKIVEAGNGKAYCVSPYAFYGTNKVAGFEETFEEIKKLCGNEDRKYIYAYCDQPDYEMHSSGCHSKAVTDWIEKIEKKVEETCHELSDTLVIVTADHGHIDLKYEIISDHPCLSMLLERQISIESRAACFYVKEQCRERFANEFQRLFGKDFLLLSKQEIMERELFGDGVCHPKFKEFIGDFIAISIADKGFVYSHESRQFASNHAGMTEQEMLVPFIAIEMK